MKSASLSVQPKRMASAMILTIFAGSASALEVRDFNLDEEGTVLVVNPRKGVRMHLDYVGSELNQPLGVSVKPEHEGLRITPHNCRFTRKNKTCELTLRYTSREKAIYGNQAIMLNSDTTPEAIPLKLIIGIKSSESPVTIKWSNNADGDFITQKGGVFIQNGTDSPRVYTSNIRNGYDEVLTSEIKMPSKTVCYLDENSIPTNTFNRNKGLTFNSSHKDLKIRIGNKVQDITDPNKPSFNDFYVKYDGKHISTCSAMGEEDCAGTRWASWTAGLFNLSDQGLYDPDSKQVYLPGTERIVRNGSWNSGNSLYHDGDAWRDSNVALILIQGAIDGNGFDPETLRLTQNQITSAPPCSSFVEKP